MTTHIPKYSGSIM